MRRTILFIAFLGVTYILWNQNKHDSVRKAELPAVSLEKRVLVSEIPPFKKEILKTIAINDIKLKAIPFEKLPGWTEVSIKQSFQAFQQSCHAFLNHSPTHSVGSKHIKLKAKDWQPACRAATLITDPYDARLRQFFETWFYPIEFTKKKPITGLFTGYYMPQIKGNLKRTKKFNTPIYGLPKDLRWKKSHYYTRAEIDRGALKNKAQVLAWTDKPIERLFLEIEGAGVIKLKDGKRIALGYAGENGARHRSIGAMMIKQGVLTKDNASKARIKRYFEEKPKMANSLLKKNESFVFFERLKKPMAKGAQGKTLTPGYSLAIDRSWIPLGSPVWLSTAIPDRQQETDKEFHRLMIAEDTGGAIKGLMRGDIFWGIGKTAAFLGEHMKHEGRFWLLLPKQAFRFGMN